MLLLFLIPVSVVAEKVVSVTVLCNALPYVDVFGQPPGEKGWDFVGRVYQNRFKKLDGPLGAAFRVQSLWTPPEQRMANSGNVSFLDPKYLDIELQDFSEDFQLIVVDYRQALYARKMEIPWSAYADTDVIDMMLVQSVQEDNQVWKIPILVGHVREKLSDFQGRCWQSEAILSVDKPRLCDHYIDRDHILIQQFLPAERWRHVLDQVLDTQNRLNQKVFSEVQNSSFPIFSKEGYAKVSLPPSLKDELASFYLANRNWSQPEALPVTSAAVGTAESDAWMLKLTDELETRITKECRQALYKWTKRKVNLIHSQNYGVRTYLKGSTLHSHVDRFHTHVLSCIVNVHTLTSKEALEKEELQSSGIDEPWLVTFRTHQGANVTLPLNPGELFLYESASGTHGRHGALQSYEVANIFLHFRPQGWPEKYFDSSYSLLYSRL